ncbi:MAG: hypothetical protein IT319_12740 [Anaerolineae bacterium]|nr:hypothetical protein [Anaerolineae bacterium]
MAGNRRWFVALLLAALVFGIAVGAAAQGDSDGTLVFGQPLPQQIEAGQILNYDYTLAQPSNVTIQALGDTTQPTIAILRDGVTLAQQVNAEGSLTVALSALLDAGTYTVQIDSANKSAGLVVVFVVNETPMTTTAITPGTPVNGAVDTGSPLALYTFTALAESALLYVESGAPSNGVGVRVVNMTTGAESAQVAPSLLGARLRIPAGSDAYQVEVRNDDASSSTAFTICLASVSTGGCEVGAAVTQPPVVTEEAPAFIPCTITPSAADGFNIRQSASTTARIETALAAGSSADVIGISPDGQFYNVLHRGYNGWVAVSAVISAGNCGTDTILIINPPPVIPETEQQQQLAPPPTAAPPAQPPQQSGACLLTLTGDQLVYTTPIAQADYIYDQVHPGYELIPTGRLADNTWWKTNYLDSWIQTSVFGTTVQVSGNCAGLPIVSP